MLLLKDRAMAVLIPAISRCVRLFRPPLRDKIWTPEEIPERPYMGAERLQLLERRLRDARVYLEYGSGGSTVLAAQLGVKEIHTVESDQSFLEAVRQRVAQCRPDARVCSHFVNIGPTREWGIPTDASAAAEWPLYCHAPWPQLLAAGVSPDVILIDGRFRVASFLVSCLCAKAGTVILFDDYYYRPQYSVVEKLFMPASRAERMAEFIIPDSFDRQDATLALLRAVTDPA